MKSLKYIVASLFLSVLAAFIYDAIKQLPLLSTISSILTWTWANVLMFEVRIWQLIIIAILSLIFVKLSRIKKLDKSNRFKFLTYKSDVFDSITWIWEWIYDPSQMKYCPINIKPKCPKCDTNMHYKSHFVGRYDAKCPRCNNEIIDIKPERDVEALIIDNIERRNI